MTITQSGQAGTECRCKSKRHLSQSRKDAKEILKSCFLNHKDMAFLYELSDSL